MGRRYCCVDDCPVRKRPDRSISLFMLPKDPVAFKKWETVLKPHRFQAVNKFCSVCELHFEPSDILRAYTTRLKDGSDYKLARGRVSLVPGALPQYFGKNLRYKSVENESPESSNQEKTYEFHIEESDESEESNQGEPLATEESNQDEPVATEEPNQDEPLATEKSNQDEPGATEESNQDETLATEETLNRYPINIDSDDIEIIDHGKEEDNIVEVIFKEEVDYVSEGEEQENVNVSDIEVNDDETAESNGNPSPGLRTELLDILGPSKEKSSVMDDDAFTRVCKTYIVTNKKRGRLSDIDKLSSPPPKKPNDGSQIPIIFPKVKLDIFTLVCNINHVVFPSDNWFCTLRDGTPVFLCWGEKFRIQKKIVFENTRLDPKVILEDEEITMDEIARPRSIHEVNNILKVVDSARKCTPKFEEFRLCKGYFLTKAGSENETMCSNCRNASFLPTEVVTETFSFDTICDSAQYLVSGRTDWSYTRLASVIIFIGWRRSYNAEKMLIVNSDLTTRVLFGDVFTTIAGLERLICIDDVKAAIEYLSLSRQCAGLGNGRRAENCVGCVVIKQRSVFGRHSLRCVACHAAKKFSYVPVKPEREKLAKTKGKGGERDEESVSLIDSLPHINFPSELWSHSVVGKTVILQNWDAMLYVIKKVVIQPDLSVQVYVLDSLVEIEGVEAVGSLREVMRLLEIVDCIRLCDGYDETGSKANECAGYVYDCNPETSSGKPRCADCMEVYRKSSLSQNQRPKIFASSIRSALVTTAEYKKV